MKKPSLAQVGTFGGKVVYRYCDDESEPDNESVEDELLEQL